MVVRLSEESRSGWDAFAVAHGVTVTGLAEAVGLTLSNGVPPHLEAEWVTIALQVKDERRSRRQDT